MCFKRGGIYILKKKSAGSIESYAWSLCLGILTFLFHRNYKESKGGSTKQRKAFSSLGDPVTASQSSSHKYKILNMAIRSLRCYVLPTLWATPRPACPLSNSGPQLPFSLSPSPCPCHLRTSGHAVPSVWTAVPSSLHQVNSSYSSSSRSHWQFLGENFPAQIKFPPHRLSNQHFLFLSAVTEVGNFICVII